MFGSSLRRLEDELAVLDADISRRAMALVREGCSPQQLLEELKPLTTRSVALKDRIRARTPWHTLEGRRAELERTVAAMPGGVDRSRARLELAQLDLYLTTNPRRRPITLLALMLFVAVVLAMVALPSSLVGWLAP